MDPVAALRPFTAIVIWSGEDSEIRSRVDALTTVLREVGGTVEAANLPALMGSLSLARSFARWASDELETPVVAKVAGQAIEADLRRSRPELALALDPLAGAVAATWRRRGLLPAAIVGVASSTLAVDPRWADATGVDRLLVIDEAQREAAVGLGLHGTESVAFDGPEAYVAAGEVGRAELRRRYGLAEDQPALLVTTEGLELDEVTDLLFQLSLVADKATLLFDTGGDEEISALLRQRAELYGITAQLFGAVPEAPELWAACDVVCGRATARTERRALAARLHLCGFAPEDAEQRARGEAFAARGLGQTVDRPALLAVELERLLQQAAGGSGAEAFDAIHQGEAPTDAVRRLAAEAPRLLAEALERGSSVRGQPASEPVKEPAPATGKRKGPLEAIGPLEPIGEGGGQRVDRDLELLELEQELARLKAEAGMPAAEPRAPRPSSTDGDKGSGDKGSGVGIDPKVKLDEDAPPAPMSSEPGVSSVEDELAALKRRLDGEP